MSPPDPRTAALVALTRRTDDVRPPSGLAARVMAAIEVRESARLRLERRTVRAAVGLGLALALSTLGLALWADHRLTEELSTGSGPTDWEAP